MMIIWCPLLPFCECMHAFLLPLSVCMPCHHRHILHAFDMLIIKVYDWEEGGSHALNRLMRFLFLFIYMWHFFKLFLFCEWGRSPPYKKRDSSVNVLNTHTQRVWRPRPAIYILQTTATVVSIEYWVSWYIWAHISSSFYGYTDDEWLSPEQDMQAALKLQQQQQDKKRTEKMTLDELAEDSSGESFSFSLWFNYLTPPLSPLCTDDENAAPEHAEKRKLTLDDLAGGSLTGKSICTHTHTHTHSSGTRTVCVL